MQGGGTVTGNWIENLFQCTELDRGCTETCNWHNMTNLLFFLSSVRSFHPFPFLMSASSFKFLPKILLIFPKTSARGALIVLKPSAKGELLLSNSSARGALTVPKFPAMGFGVLRTKDGENCKSLLCLLKTHYFLLFSNYTLCLKYWNFFGLKRVH